MTPEQQSHGPQLVIGMGNPWVHKGYPYPYPRKPLPLVKGTGLHRYGSGVSEVAGFLDQVGGVKISPRVSQKRLRFGDNVGKREFIKFAKKYHQQLEEECASVGRITARAMSPPRLADIGVLLQEAEEATHD